MGIRHFGYIFILTLLLAYAGEPAYAQNFGQRISHVYLSAMPAWMYNGFTETRDGDSVQGSDVSPLRMTFGGGFELRLTDTVSMEPEGWLFMQEYIALEQYDKTVPTQIETGSAIGDIANTIGLAFSLPVVYSWRPGWSGKWEFDSRAGLALIYRIPIGGIDGTDAGPAAAYWFAGRFIYPQVGFAADYQFTSRAQVGVGVDWYIPLYNAWDTDEPTPFLDETMLRWGARVRWAVGGPKP